MSTIISQDELNELHVDEKGSIDNDLVNIMILIKNELQTFESGICYYDPKSKSRIKRKLNKVLNEIINIRKK